MISFTEKIKYDEDWLKIQHTRMKFFLDDGIIICKDNADTYTFLETDSINAFNFNMPLELDYIKPISDLDNKYEDILNKLISLDKEFSQYFNIISIISNNLILQNPHLNSFYRIPLKDFEILNKSSDKEKFIKEILEFNQYRPLLSPYNITFSDNELFVC